MTVPGVNDAAGGPSGRTLPPITSSQQSASAAGGRIAEAANNHTAGDTPSQNLRKPQKPTGISDGTYRLGDLLGEDQDPHDVDGGYDPDTVLRQSAPPIVESQSGSGTAAAALRLINRRC